MPPRRSNFNKMLGWPHAVESIGAAGLHVHDLRHTGNQFAANSGAALKDLMTRMGHDSEHAALIYQHEARGADQRITDAIGSHVQAESDQSEDDDDGTARALVPLANCTLIARKAATTVKQQGSGSEAVVLTWGFAPWSG